MPRLYTVTVEFDYAVMAENESEACRYAREAARDLDLENYASAIPTVVAVGDKDARVRRPDDYDEDTLCYGPPGMGDILFEKAVEMETGAINEARRKAEFAKKQGSLF